MTDTAVEFDRFRLIPSQALLLKDGVSCPVGSRAMAILIALVEQAGETVTKQALFTRAWPDNPVVEANLRMHIAALRKLLGDGQDGTRFILNVTGRGYCFIAPLRHISDPGPAAKAAGNPHNLPTTWTRVIGRSQDIALISQQVPRHRCVTVVGPGGIGKTIVAVAAAERLLPIYDDGVRFADLAAVTDPELVRPALMAVLPQDGLLRERRLLLVLDNCEQVVESVAFQAERLLRDSPHMRILATSRETLRLEGEWVHRLGPIATPSEIGVLTAAQAITYPAVQLFVDCAKASLEKFEMSDADAPAVADICRRLDGLPLAIELAASRIDLFGLHGLGQALDGHFLLASEGRRTAPPRQQSLLHTLEWSYGLLSPVEQRILRRLSVFGHGFTLDAAVAIAGGAGIEPEQVYDALLTLSAKSLVSIDRSDDTPCHRHRLLHVMRAFLRRKLHLADETEEVVSRYEAYLSHPAAEGL